MLTDNELISILQQAIPRFQQNWLNAEQENAVFASPFPPVFIVAGPGTGKTTVLALRVLKLIFVDNFIPESIIATTFTRKAASELRSRIISWGYTLYEALKLQFLQSGNTTLLNHLIKIDINKVRTGTLDSLAEEIISENRPPGQVTPVIIDELAALTIMKKYAIFTSSMHTNATLRTYLNQINPEFGGANALSSLISICTSFSQRVVQDDINLTTFSQGGIGQQLLSQIVLDYSTRLSSLNLLDYSMLEKTLLNMIRSNQVPSIANTQALLVDEFQDSNYLQEQIYFDLCSLSNASLTVVGDDDQSIYRFRGATVEIFADFENRLSQHLGQQWRPLRINLHENYRSTERIVNLCNHFITMEPDYQTARVPNKMHLTASANNAHNPLTNVPVLGMFRDNVTDLARDLSQLLLDIFRGNGYTVNVANNRTFSITMGQGGDFGDAVLLGRTANEFSSTNKARLPLMLRNYLAASGVGIFNPRGRQLAAIEEVGILLGLLLECLDPNGIIQSNLRFTSAVQQTLTRWRTLARDFINSNPPPQGLGQFVADWGNRFARNMGNWPPEWPLLELVFTLITWLPFFQSDPEGQVYLESIARATVAASSVSTYGSMILNGRGNNDAASIREVYWEVLVPVADGTVKVNEDIMPFVPRNYLPIMTIHQAKGLEFPLVVVDVGSDYQTNHRMQRPFRFPDSGNNVHHTEDAVATCCLVGQARLLRNVRQRSFDDIRRLFFVAKSRSQSILLLIGRNQQIRNVNPIPTIALGDLYPNGPRNYDFVDANQWSSTCPANTIVLI
ncbi:MAG TPA: DEAD/DEAH box helicase [Syntrophomonadaceae bacterium]|nr:DEAD/DEAH box helicase [Syntrophomonadaceae bacterium]